MKLPSFQQVLRESGRTFRRFPFVILSAVVATAAALILVDYEGKPGPTILYNILLASALGIPLLIAIALVAEKRKWGRGISAAVQLAGILLLVAYGTTVPTDLFNAPAIHLFRFMMLGVALLFLVAFAPFGGRGEVNGFWFFNKSLFLRILTSVLYTMVLYAGFALALAALDNLFGMDVPPKRYGELWILMGGLFATWFFLAGMPEDLAELEKSSDYPKGLKIFAQYILLPIVVVYFVILYAYIGKILFTWDWPKGWVSGLILGFSTAGILALILLYPLREQTENRWMKRASGWFVVVMIPLVVMLFLAIWRRISEYGVTEGRYIVCLIGLWLAIMVAYFLFSKGKNIKVIPATLCLFSFLASFGPWGAFAVSEGNQVGRLERLLTRNAILVDGKITKAEKPVSFEDSEQISSIVDYLHNIHGYGRIESWFGGRLTADSTDGKVVQKGSKLVAEIMGVEYVAARQMAPNGRFTVVVDREDALGISGYDRMVRRLPTGPDQLEWSRPGEPCTLRMNAGLDTLTIVSRIRSGDSLQIDFSRFFDGLVKRHGEKRTTDIPQEEMSVVGSGERMMAKVCFRSVSFMKREGKMKPADFSADLLYSIRP